MRSLDFARDDKEGMRTRHTSFVIRRSSFPDWRLPHLLGLDAPLVAVTWQLWWARSLSVELSWVHHVTLALAVWMIYLADRLADAATLRPAAKDTEISARHHFAWRHRQALAALLGGVSATLVVLTLGWLSAREFRAGLGLLAAQAVYFGWIHRWGRGERESRPVDDSLSWRKEAWVGGSFALGTIWFSGCAARGNISSDVLAALCGWSAVCFLNCALISRWEQRRAPSTAHGIAGRWLNPACAGVAGFSMVSGPALGRVIWPVALAAVGLWWLDRLWTQRRLSRENLRVLADIVLLAPIPLLLVF